MSRIVGRLRRLFQNSRFLRGAAPAVGPVLLTQRCIYILPTPRGLGFVLLITLLLLTAFVYNNNLVYMLGFLAASVFFVAILHSFRELQGLEIRAGSHQPVFCGERAGFSFQVANPEPRQRLALTMMLEQSRQFDLVAGEMKMLTLSMTTKQRGWLPCPTVTVVSEFPLGLFRAWSPLRFDTRVLVYPQPAQVMPPFSHSDGSGLSDQRGQGKGDEFEGVTNYRHGDPIRHIHWKSLAKGRGLEIRQYGGDLGSTLWLEYAAAPGVGVEERLSVLCRWLIEAEQTGLRYGLLLPNGRIEPDAGVSHFHGCLQMLAEFA